MSNTSSLYSSCIHGTGLKVVSSVPKIRKQGNGNYTGYLAKTYTDGTMACCTFIENAASVEAVRAAFHRASH